MARTRSVPARIPCQQIPMTWPESGTKGVAMRQLAATPSVRKKLKTGGETLLSRTLCSLLSAAKLPLKKAEAAARTKPRARELMNADDSLRASTLGGKEIVQLSLQCVDLLWPLACFRIVS